MNAQEQKSISDGLSARLDELEEVVGVPPVAGELAPWCETISDELNRATESFRVALSSHGEVFRTILDVDLEMAARVEKLRATDKALEDEFRQLRKEVHRALEVAAGGDLAEGDEPKTKVDELRDALLSWIVRCRAHEKEVRVWYLEAFNRDRGEQD